MEKRQEFTYEQWLTGVWLGSRARSWAHPAWLAQEEGNRGRARSGWGQKMNTRAPRESNAAENFSLSSQLHQCCSDVQSAANSIFAFRSDQELKNKNENKKISRLFVKRKCNVVINHFSLRELDKFKFEYNRETTTKFCQLGNITTYTFIDCKFTMSLTKQIAW